MQQLQRNAQLKIISCFPLTKTWRAAVNHSVAECCNSKHSKCKISITKRLLWSVTTCICKSKIAVWFYSAKIFCSCSGHMIKHTFFLFLISLKKVCQRYKSQQLWVSFVTSFTELQVKSQMSSFLKRPGVTSSCKI